MNWRLFLWPLSLPYGWITALRNQFFDLGWKKSKSYPLPIICIGNLSTGGTGKTPMTEFILKNINPGHGAMVSRGYGRKTKGLILANPSSSVEEIGDEPYQIFQKFPEIKMALSEKRTLGVEAILKMGTTDFIVLDDAYQHRYVKASISVLLSTFQNPYYSDFILPAGNLREPKNGVSRADIVVITKCPETLKESQAQTIKKKIPNKRVFFSTIKYGDLRPVNPQNIVDHPNRQNPPNQSSVNPQNIVDQPDRQNQQYQTPVNPQNIADQRDQKDQQDQQNQPPIKTLALTGIANPKPFLDHLKGKFEIVEHRKFPDHHNFSKTDIDNLGAYLKSDPNNQIITTEKDWVRLKGRMDDHLLKRIFYLPIELKILFEEEKSFTSLIEDHIKDF